MRRREYVYHFCRYRAAAAGMSHGNELGPRRRHRRRRQPGLDPAADAPRGCRGAAAADDRRGRARAGHPPQRAHAVRQARRFAHAAARGVPRARRAGPGRAAAQSRRGGAASSTKDIAETFEVIAGLEAMSGELACARITDDEVNEIRALHFEMLACHAVRDLPGYYRLNHRSTTPSTGRPRNDVLRQTYTNINSRLQALRFRSNFDRDKWDAAVREHSRDDRGARRPRRRRAWRQSCARTSSPSARAFWRSRPLAAEARPRAIESSRRLDTGRPRRG